MGHDQELDVGFDLPDSTVLARYLSWPSFLYFFEEEKLSFGKWTKYADNFEGRALTVKDRRNLKAAIEQLEKRSVKNEDEKYQLAEFRQLLRRDRREEQNNADIGQTIYISSWSLFECESVGLWKTYLPDNFGLVVCARVDQVKKFIGHNDKLKFGLSKCVYGYDNPLAPHENKNGLSGFRMKPKAFEFEKEVRLSIPLLKQQHMSMEKIAEYYKFDRVSLGLDLTNLVHRIVVPPNLPDWQIELIKNFLKRKFLDTKLIRSELDRNEDQDISNQLDLEITIEQQALEKALEHLSKEIEESK